MNQLEASKVLDAAKTRQKDYWVDGHFIVAHSPSEAVAECERLYWHTPETVRPWRLSDND